MKIDNISHIQNCFDGSFIKEVLFETPISDTFIYSLKQWGKLEYHTNFAKPYFKIVFQEGLYMKGVQGSQKARLVVRSENDVLLIKKLFK